VIEPSPIDDSVTLSRYTMLCDPSGLDVVKEIVDAPAGKTNGLENTLIQLLENSPEKKTLGL
jgi:hypothetical protein